MSAPVQSLIVICTLIFALALMVLLRPQGAEAVISVLHAVSEVVHTLTPGALD